MDSRIFRSLAEIFSPNILQYDKGFPENTFLIRMRDANYSSVQAYLNYTILSHGFYGYIAKPIDENLFYNIINGAIYGKR